VVVCGEFCNHRRDIPRHSFDENNAKLIPFPFRFDVDIPPRAKSKRKSPGAGRRVKLDRRGRQGEEKLDATTGDIQWKPDSRAVGWRGCAPENECVF